MAGVDADEFVRSRNTTSDIADINRAKPEARTAIKTIEYFGLTIVSDYRPKESTNRGQFASFIYRLLINVLENEAVLDELAAYKWSKVLDVNSIKINEEGNILTAANSKPSVTVTIAKDDGTSIGSGTVNNNGNLTINLGESVEEGQNLLITIDDNGVTYTIPYVVKDKISIPGVPSEPTNPPIEPPGGGGTVPPPSGGGGGSTIEYATPAAIAALKELINSVPLVAVSMDGSNIPMDQNWTTLEAKQALQDALLAAEQVANKRNPTAAEIKAAEQAVKAAIDAYEAALERVNELPASDLKTSLLERLEAVKEAVLAAEANKKAQDLVLLAELEFTEEALQEALNAVEALLDERMKEMLENRLELIQAILDKDNERIEQARAKVSVDEAAEATFNAAGQIGTLEEAEQLWDRANAAVEALPESTLKEMLQNKLAALTSVNTAIGLVETAENAKTPAAITAAKQAVNALLANVPEKSILQQRLAALDQLVNNEAKLQEAIEAVEAVEQNPTQQGLDDARELVNALRPSEDKTALNNRLDLVEAILAEDEEGIQNGQATVSVDRAVKATAEAAKGNMTAAEAKVEVDKARALVDALPASAVKAVLEDRLADLTRDLAATTLVEAAEGEKTQAAVDAAKQALSTLPNSANKAELKARLQAVQNALNDAKLQAAKDAVDALEKNPTIEGVESARDLVNELSNSRDKNDLNARIDAVEAALEAADKLEEATNAVTDLEQNPTQPKLDEVQELVNELPDSEEKEALQDRIDAVQDALDEAAQKLQEAKDAVAAVEANPTQKGVDDARDLVAALPDSKDKDALNNRLDLVQAILDGDDAAIKEAEAKVAVDEAIAATDDAVNGDATADEAQEQLDEAAILVDALPDSPTKTELQEELAQLQDVIDAVQAVEDAEASKTDEAKDAAQQAIDALPDGDDKTTLQNRLDELSEQPDTNTEALAEAIAKAENVPFVSVSADGKDIDPSEQWTTQAEKDAFTKAIADARDVLNNPEATQEQIDAAVKQVEDAMAAYEAAKEAGAKTDGGTPTDPEAVDRNALEIAIATAQAEVIVGTSETGAEYGSNEYWTTPAAKATFEQAIAAAETVFNNTNATQEQVDAAASTLNTALATYKAAKQPGTHVAPEDVNTDALLAAVQDAEDVFVAVSPDGTDIDPSEQWTTPEAKEALEDARDVLGNPDATQAEIDAAEEALAEAVAAYDAAKKPGTKGEGETPTAPNTQGLADALTDAIAEANDVLNNPEATQAEIDEAETALEDAIATYNEAKQAGTKDEGGGGTPVDPGDDVNRNALELAIATAQAEVIVGTSETGSEYGSNEYWTTPAAKATFEQAIAAAETVFNNTNATQEQVDAAASTLNTALATYKAAKQPGTHTAPENANTDDLLAAVQDAEDVFVAVSPDGKDIDPSDQWTTPEAKEALEEAIADARDVLGKEDATQAEIDAAEEALAEAVAAYEDAKKSGTKEEGGTPVDPGEVDKDALTDAITAAEEAFVAVSTDGADVDPSDEWTTAEEKAALEEAITEARDVLNNADATQEEVDAAKEALEEAVAAYEDAKKLGTEEPLEPIAAQDVIDTIALNYTGSVKTNENIGELVVDASVTEVNIVQLQLLQIIDAGVISQLGNNALEFTVGEGETLDYSFNTTIQAVVGTGGYNIGLYKKQEDGQYKLMDQNSFTYLTVLGVPIQTAYDFSFKNIEAGEYVMATFPSGTVNAEAISAVTTTITSTSLAETAELVNAGSQTASATGTIDVTTGATITSVTPKSIEGATATTNVATIQGAYGTLTLDAQTGEYTYTSNGAREAIGKVDVFEYTVDNGEETATATLYIQHNVVENGSVVELRWDENNPAADAILAEPISVIDVSTITSTDSSVNEVVRNLTVTRITTGDTPLVIETDPNSVPAPGAETDDTIGHLFVKGTDSILTFRPFIPIGTYGLPAQNFVVNYKVEKVDLETGQGTEVWSGNVEGAKLSGVEANDIHLRNLERGYYRITATRVSTAIAALALSYGIQNVKVTDVNWTANEVSVSQPIVTADAQAVTGNVGYLAPGGNIQVEGTTILSGRSATFNGDYGTLVMNSDGTYTYNGNPSLVNNTAPGKSETFTYTLVDVHGNESAPQTITINLVAGQTYSIPNPSTGQIITVTQAIPTASIEPLRYSVVDNALAIATIVDASILS